MHLHCLLHVPFEDAANLGVWARDRGHTLSETRLYAGEPLPGNLDFDWLVGMGGLMSVGEEQEYPWLIDEKRFLGEAIAAGKKYVGICLGAQLIAEVLGGTVRKHDCREIGWFPLRRTEAGKRCPVLGSLPEPFAAFQWHGDTFSIPADCENLIQGETCTNQAFLFRHQALALQFHLEYSRESIEKMFHHCGDDLKDPAPTVQTADHIRGHYHHLEENQRLLNLILDRFAALDA
jgi:GMP synthase-like glutamine amidotransferase